jgi:hypothetical protein
MRLLKLKYQNRKVIVQQHCHPEHSRGETGIESSRVKVIKQGFLMLKGTGLQTSGSTRKF